VVAAVIGRALPTAIPHLVADPVWPPAVRSSARTASGRELADVRTIAVATIAKVDRTAA
jgi:hypothetical protein